ncbi:response regulator transcription factor [Solitalea sp. MAHUQ-68]|uniref:Response regulator transcription factor n=1 Tax=Solitalea agri TaxID=2953739 RepID=A0A9X2F116_9SPHI|nr:response regulator transcription factor [Solitalea agri]MCO4292677.1 response regulator transcription factor [Solitalea agri]
MIISIVEDNKTYAEVLRQVISQSEKFTWKYTYRSAEEALQNINQNVPDILIVDISLPGITGIELIPELKKQYKDIRFLVCSIHDDDDSIFSALKNGADGYILKDSNIDDILSALTDLVSGGAPMSPYIARKVIGSFHQTKKPSPPEQLLTQREKEILEFTATGLSYKEIADKLHLSNLTVKKHMRNIYTKLEVQNKIEALKKSRIL